MRLSYTLGDYRKCAVSFPFCFHFPLCGRFSQVSFG